MHTTWISHVHLMGIRFTLPPVVHFSKIFHRGCMDFKWSSPLLSHLDITCTPHGYHMYTSWVSHSHSPCGTLFQNLPQGVYGFQMEQPNVAFLVFLRMLLVNLNELDVNRGGGGGATRMARGGIRLVHGHTKSTLITYFSGIKIDPKYHVFFRYKNRP